MIFSPTYLTSSTSRLKREPPHTLFAPRHVERVGLRLERGDLLLDPVRGTRRRLARVQRGSQALGASDQPLGGGDHPLDQRLVGARE